MQTKYLLPFASLAVQVLLVMLLLGSLRQARSQAEQVAASSLSAVLDTAVAGLERWQEGEVALVEIVAANPQVTHVTQILLDTPTDALLDSPAQEQARAILKNGPVGERHEGFFLVSPDGISLASSRDVNVGTLNLLVGTDGTLQSALEGRAGMSRIQVSDVPLESGRYTMLFSAAPVRDDEGRPIAVLLLRIDPSRTIAPVLSSARLGLSGETYALDQHGVLLTESRFGQELHELGLVEEDQTEALNLLVVDPLSPASGTGRPAFTHMARQVMLGQDGVSLQAYRDYRGVPVVGKWVWYEPLRLGIATEQDADEAYAVLRSQACRHAAGTGLTMAVVVALTTLLLVSREQLDELNRSLEQRVRSKRRFLARVSHDLRTPMNAVLGLLHLAQEPDITPSRRVGYLQRAEGAAGLLLGLLNDVLDLSRIEANKLTLGHVHFSLSTVLAPMTDLANTRDGVEFEIQVDDAVPDSLMGDPLRLSQVLSNLIGNAAKFTEQGTIRLVVTCGAQPEVLCFEVIDTGIGIDSAEIERLLQPFTQAGPDTERSYGGAGLGLSICVAVAELMGGALQISSVLGQGTTVRFSARLPAASMPKPLRAPPVVELTGVRVLVVDDSPVNRTVARGMLQKAGCEVFEAGGGREALETLQTVAFDLVLMDLQMPGMDGFETCRRARAQGYDRPVLSLSASAMQQEVGGPMMSQFDQCLTKPISYADLVDSVARSVGRNRTAAAAGARDGISTMAAQVPARRPRPFRPNHLRPSPAGAAGPGRVRTTPADGDPNLP